MRESGKNGKMEMDQWQNVYNQYPINEELIWFNNCGTTSPSRAIIKEVSLFLEGFGKRGVLTHVQDFHTTNQNIKEKLSALLHCEQEELALIHNTSEGMNLISWGLRLQKGDRLLLLENEYPSNIYPWEHWQEKGVIIDFVPVGNTPEQFMDYFEKAAKNNVRAVSFSAVHWCTGMPLPLREIGEFCQKKDISFILDGAQGVGHIPIIPHEMKIDAVVFPAWKWLLGPLGLGVMYISNQFINKIDYVFKGQSSVVDSDHYLPYKKELKAGAKRYEYSTPAFMEWVYFQESLKMLHSIGFEKIRERIYELSHYLSQRLTGIGCDVLADSFASVQTGIIVFEKKGISSEAIIHTFKMNNIVGALRLGRVRLSPHIYNSIEQIDTIISVLEKIE